MAIELWPALARMADTKSRIETDVQSSVRVETRETAAIRRIESGEPATDKHLSIWLHRDGLNRTVWAGACVETIIESPIRVESGNTDAVCTVHTGKGPARQNPAIRLQSER